MTRQAKIHRNELVQSTLASVVIALIATLTTTVAQGLDSPQTADIAGGSGAGGGTLPPPRQRPELQRLDGCNLMPMVNMHHPMIGLGALPYYKLL